MNQRTKVDDLRDALKKKREIESPTAVPDDAPSAAEPVETQSPEIDAAAVLLERAEAAEAQLLRVMAETENFRKRSERERAEALTYANERLLKEIIPLLDHLDGALATVPAGNDCPDAVRPLAEGVELTRRQFLSSLSNFGFEEIAAEVGQLFDPAVHEATAQIDAEGISTNHIVTRLRRGYALGARPLRAALVVVAK